MEVVHTPATMKSQTAASSNGSPAVRKQSFEEININLIHESKHNPRQHFDEAALKELAESIREVGVLTPCLVRPRDGGGFELAAGHRRYRASKIAGLATMPCIVRPMNDQEFMAVLTIENLQREDVHPLDEAKGYEALVNPPYRWKVETIAGKVKKSARYVYDSLNLVKLGQTAQELFWAGKIEKSHAVLLTRLSSADQDRCINDHDGLFRGERTLYHTEEELKDKSPFAGHVACSVRELQDWIARHVRFEPTKADPVLYPKTVQAVAAAAEDKRKIVLITHEYLAHEDVRNSDNQRVFGERAWKRADGQDGSKFCNYAVLGVIASGEEYGEAFKVCIRKDKCDVHWGAEIKAREKAKTQPGGLEKARAEQESRWRKEQVERERKEEDWKKALPKVLAHVAAAVAKMPVKANSPIGSMLCDFVNRGASADAVKLLKRGTTAEDLVRHAVFLGLHEEATGWEGWEGLPQLTKKLGIDLKAVLKPGKPVLQTSANEAADEEVRRENRRGDAKGRAIEKRRAKKGKAA